MTVADRVNQTVDRRGEHHAGEHAIERVPRPDGAAERAIAEPRVEGAILNRCHDVMADGRLVLRPHNAAATKAAKQQAATATLMIAPRIRFFMMSAERPACRWAIDPVL